jgi:hypothetical protein
VPAQLRSLLRCVRQNFNGTLLTGPYYRQRRQRRPRRRRVLAPLFRLPTLTPADVSALVPALHSKGLYDKALFEGFAAIIQVGALASSLPPATLQLTALCLAATLPWTSQGHPASQPVCSLAASLVPGGAAPLRLRRFPGLQRCRTRPLPPT